MTNQVYTFVRYYRKPTPSCNWCPRYTEVYLGKALIERRLNSQSIEYKGERGCDAEVLGYNHASNVVMGQDSRSRRKRANN